MPTIPPPMQTALEGVFAQSNRASAQIHAPKPVERHRAEPYMANARSALASLATEAQRTYALALAEQLMDTVITQRSPGTSCGVLDRHEPVIPREGGASVQNVVRVSLVIAQAAFAEHSIAFEPVLLVGRASLAIEATWHKLEPGDPAPASIRMLSLDTLSSPPAKAKAP